jgi:mono/diheme cytochrome c family protein
MKSNQIYLLIVVALIVYSCGGPSKKSENDSPSTSVIEKDTTAKGNITYLDISGPLDESLIAEGRSIFEQRCDNCHRLDTTKLVGPGWAGITNRRSPEWIMNMILNVSIMIEQDSIAHHLKSQNETKMPNQNLAVDKARSILEFMRKNDLDQTATKDQGDTK